MEMSQIVRKNATDTRSNLENSWACSVHWGNAKASQNEIAFASLRRNDLSLD